MLYYALNNPHITHIFATKIFPPGHRNVHVDSVGCSGSWPPFCTVLGCFDYKLYHIFLAFAEVAAWTNGILLFVTSLLKSVAFCHHSLARIHRRPPSQVVPGHSPAPRTTTPIPKTIKTTSVPHPLDIGFPAPRANRVSSCFHILTKFDSQLTIQNRFPSLHHYLDSITETRDPPPPPAYSSRIGTIVIHLRSCTQAYSIYFSLPDFVDKAGGDSLP